MKGVVVCVVLLSCLMSTCWASNCTMNCGAGTYCCDDICCENRTEGCCPDKVHGSICCVQETTYCCAPEGIYSSHCCPRWNVCCNGGRYGCCDPATGKPMEENFGYALFVLQKGFSALKIDLNSGSYTQIPVTGYNDWEEITRVFTYDAVNNIFYQLQADFLNTPQAPTHNITLYAIDPTTGSTTAKTVIGCSEAGQTDVPGFAYNPSTKQLVMSTYYYDSNNRTGYKYYTIDPSTAVATLVSQIINDTDSYAGWFKDISEDGKTLYRLGYQDVVNQQISGVGLTDISEGTATTKWVADVPVPKGYQFYTSFSLYGDSNILSLAPDSSNNLNLVQWQIGGTASVLSKFSNAHITPVFGPIIEFVNSNQTQYSALLVQDNVLTDLDKWALTLVSLPSGSSREIALTPALYAKLESAAAFGIPV